MAVIPSDCEVGPKPELHIPDIFAGITAHVTETQGGQTRLLRCVKAQNFVIS